MTPILPLVALLASAQPPAPDLDPPAVRADRVRPRRSSVTAPGMALTAGLRHRPDTQPALALSFQLDALSHGKLVGGVELGVSPARSVDHGRMWRSFWDLDLTLAGGVVPTRALRLEVLAGMTFRSFRQQATPIDEALVPFVGAAGEASLGGRLRAGVRVRATTELVRIRLIDEQGAPSELLPVEIGAALVLRLSPPLRRLRARSAEIVPQETCGFTRPRSPSDGGFSPRPDPSGRVRTPRSR